MNWFEVFLAVFHVKVIYLNRIGYIYICFYVYRYVFTFILFNCVCICFGKQTKARPEKRDMV